MVQEKEPSSLPPDEWARKLVDAIAFNNLFEGKKLFAEAVMNCTNSQLKDALELFLKVNRYKQFDLYLKLMISPWFCF